jgi:hypothetical protein
LLATNFRSFFSFLPIISTGFQDFRSACWGKIRFIIGGIFLWIAIDAGLSSWQWIAATAFLILLGTVYLSLGIRGYAVWYCRRCGEEVEENQEHCGRCGLRQKWKKRPEKVA